MLAMFWPFKVTDLRWTVFWLVLLLAFAVGQEFAPVTTTDDATEEAGLPHGESGRFLAEQAACLEGSRFVRASNVLRTERQSMFWHCDQRLIAQYSNPSVWFTFEEYVGEDFVAKLPRANWLLFPMKE